jgi:hypothetical protein
MSFSAAPSALTTGQSTTLQWSVSNATTTQIDGGVGNVSSSGQKSVTPAATTTYGLTATNAGGSASARRQLWRSSTAGTRSDSRRPSVGTRNRSVTPTTSSRAARHGQQSPLRCIGLAAREAEFSPVVVQVLRIASRGLVFVASRSGPAMTRTTARATMPIAPTSATGSVQVTPNRNA